MYKNKKKKQIVDTKRIVTSIIFFLLVFILIFLTLNIKKNNVEIGAELAKVKVTPYMGTATQADYTYQTTILSHDVKLPRYDKDDPLSTGGNFLNPYNTKLVNNISEAEYKKTLSARVSVQLAIYNKNTNRYSVAVTKANTTGKAIDSIVAKINNIKFVYTDLGKVQNYAAIEMSPKEFSSQKENKYGVLGFLGGRRIYNMKKLFYPNNGAGTLSFDAENNNWVFDYSLNLYPTGKKVDVKLLSYVQFQNLISKNHLFLMWSDNANSWQPHIPTNTQKRIEVYLDQIEIVYIAQSKALIPGFFVCGKATYVDPTIHVERVCGISEAVDYGDY